jgi:hypothetical protein
MPGFNIAPFGGGYSNNGPSNIGEIRRTHRWVFETLGRGTGQFSQQELLVLESAARPSFKFDKPEMHHNQEVSRYAGKQDWEPITLTWYDYEQNPDISRGIYHWVETVVNLKSIKVAHPKDYKKTGSLAMLDGAGQTTEIWTMLGTWPESSNWQDLNYTSTDLQTLEVVMSYDRAVRARGDGSCVQVPPPQVIQPSCPN